ncbi:Cytochrome c554 and c-prime [Ferrimonas sediminum]|uniref:Cytochrome c554 and c-prime n=2 Tax=Ferrimonas sediminum TaxID=718193 RepID=A0A1G8K5K9_9GAMM|nr:Cytochrome c554 and c-prime [Ferrimonas sediminum]
MTLKRNLVAALLCTALPLTLQASETQPYAPSYLTVVGDKAPALKDWSEPKRCKGCHPRQWTGWQGSMHSIAFIDPVFQSEWAMGDKETDGVTRNLCGGCHTAFGTVTQTVEFDPDQEKNGLFTTQGVAAKGISCEVCHSVVDTNMRHTAMGEHGNGSLALANDKVKRGPLSDAKARGHQAEYSELHTKSEFCANCHNVFNPAHDNFALEHTYQEWKASPYAESGIQCQDCHMVPVEAAIRVADEMKPVAELANHGLGGKAARGGKQRPLVHDHGFVGGNAVLAPLLGVKNGEEHAAEAKKRLKSAATVDTKIIRDGDDGVLQVTVHNRRAGHALPTSLTFIRQVWLEVVIRDSQGKELLRSGSLDADNLLPEGTVLFQNGSVDAKGNPEHKPWKIARFATENTIAPKGHKTVEYRFSLPEGADDYRVETKLNYRSFDQGVADYLLKDKVLVPSVEMASLSQVFNGTQLKASEASF